MGTGIYDYDGLRAARGYVENVMQLPAVYMFVGNYGTIQAFESG